MNDVYAVTQNENKMFRAIQNKVGAFPNAVIGAQTMSDIAIALDADCFPVTLRIYGHPVIIGNDLIAWSPNEPLAGFDNSMLGSFTYPRATTPCSVLVNRGVAICENSCHAHIGKPESVIYRLENGKYGIKRVLSARELPEGVKWAVGGMGLLDMYNPEAEGFAGVYADVLRKTNHNVLAVKNDKVYGIYFKNMTAQQINEVCRDKMKVDLAILLDGGGLAAMNGTESFAKINTKCKQGYAIQFI